MQSFKLQYRSDTEKGVETLSFEAHSLNGALDVAKKRARGEWAVLLKDGKPVCDLELVPGTEVWVIGQGNSNREELPS